MPHEVPYEGPWVAEATRIIEQFSVPTDIDRLVDFLRSRHYPSLLRGRTPLLVSDRMFEGYMPSANRRYLLKPVVLASAFWNNFLEQEQYFGKTVNLRAQLIRRQQGNNGDRVSLVDQFVDWKSLIAFNVEGDLMSTDGRVDSVMARRYALYLSSPKYYEALYKAKIGANALRQSVRDLLDQAAFMYSSEAVYSEPILWLSSMSWNYDKTNPGLRENRTRFQRAISNAKTVEGYSVTHPYTGGLPGLGKGSR